VSDREWAATSAGRSAIGALAVSAIVALWTLVNAIRIAPVPEIAAPAFGSASAIAAPGLGAAADVEAAVQSDLFASDRSAPARRYRAPGEESALAQLDSKTEIFCAPDFRDVARKLRTAAVFVVNDSGPIHLAAAVGTPVVGLYGPGSPELCAPPACAGRFFYHALDCSPCGQTHCVRPENHCVNLIPVSVVVEAVRELSEKAQ